MTVPRHAGRRPARPAGAAFLLALGAAVLCSCAGQPAPAPSPPSPWDDSVGGFASAGVYFLPVGAPGDERRPAQEVWDGLLPAVGGDPESLALAGRLHGGVPVQLVVPPDRAATD